MRGARSVAPVSAVGLGGRPLDEKAVRALVVEDDDAMRNLVQTFIDLSDSAVEVVSVAADGADAIAHWRADDPDVIVLDLRMAESSGLEVAKEILAEDPDQPIVLFSAHMHPAVVAEAARVGVRECIEKDRFRHLPAILERHGRRLR